MALSEFSCGTLTFDRVDPVQQRMAAVQTGLVSESVVMCCFFVELLSWSPLQGCPQIPHVHMMEKETLWEQKGKMI